MRRRAATWFVVVALAACESRLDVITPNAVRQDGGAGAHPDVSVHGFDAAPPLHDASGVVHDATPPVHDAAVRPPDVVKPPGHAVTVLRASTSDTCAVATGTLYCWGKLADGSTSSVPARVAGVPDGAFRSVSGGATAHCATRTTGAVSCWGSNDRGELGQGDRTARTTPALVALHGSTRDVAGRYDVFCTRLDDGHLECWGQNDEGQMGQSDVGTPMDALVPVQVESATDWLAASTGQGHVCGIRAPGALYCWGRNTDGELGQGSGAPVQLRTPTLVAGANDWTTVVAGQNHTCGLRGTGALYCFGSGEFGQLGVEPRASTAVPVRVGDVSDYRVVSTDTFHGCAIRASGALYCWGRNAEGQLGLGDMNDRNTPAEVGTDTDWADVSVGRFHTCAVRTDGTAWCTGANDNGQLGTADTNRRDVFTPVVWSER